MNIIGIDPSYRRIGIYKLKTHPMQKSIVLENGFYYIINKCPANYEDRFLYELSNILKKILDEKENFVVIEYTFVPYLKPMSLINRTIGGILATCHPYLDGWLEIDMNTIYRHFNIKRKKEFLRSRVLELIPTERNDNVFLSVYEIDEKNTKLKTGFVHKNELNQDCIDAFALVFYIWKS